MVAPSELPIDRNASAVEMAETIFGDGVTIVSASYTGDRDSSGIYTDGDSVSPEVTPGDTGVMFSTGDLRGFTNGPGGPWWNPNQANESNSTTTNSSGPNNVADFNAAAGTNTYDASFLDVDFIPSGDVMTMQFVFASDEYPEFASGAYQDFVGVWVNGTQVNLEVGDGDVDPNNLNAGSNANLFVDNTNGDYNTEMDGFTVTMTLTIPVEPDEVNSIRIGIADVVDSNYDSTLLIAGDSVQTALVAEADSDTIYPNGSVTTDVLANDSSSSGGSLTITHINGQPVVVGSTITLATGQTVTLNSDGTLTTEGDGDIETVNFTYTVEDDAGQMDTGFVTIDSIPCFVAGTLIATSSGQVPVEWLSPGDMVLTRDDGPQPLRWVGRRTVTARGAYAPICIRAGAFGAHQELWVSPEHRILIRDSLAELLFGEAEVLVAAKHLVNDHSVRRIEGGEVEYCHLMFDRHQVVISEGLETESFLPGPQIAHSFAPDTLAEICALFPELDPATGAGYSAAARRTLKTYEARILANMRQVA
ncbi:Hint domain-containing protein [Lutimaribacter sp. EGI FJ00015]|uniref:Hint domain-containing protein n=1 Tax=Lutimaribacter degradans TaxID=2945989 RepID=A0ACC5ZV10_9RHOB|nr:Hint domain-containing protein [Lutimaribacter sp. EGI FJ00013]MCM2561783.1 Hint domain-containing protein [Lutimaribacter sp. EGI FJ00013]MCO0613184.1 Hint domain-containing protein [Lutimaribacter sp. EGI FJ00015]MCO0635616.1 Hint domain-containing protein [Lutimaribacter sp. EGI FJ00014]